MPVTLAQAKLNATDKIDTRVIDEFRKSSWLLDNITFDDTVVPSGGSTLVYGYTRLITQPTAGFRAINAEYTPQEVTKQRYTTEPRPLGGSFQIDRVLDDMSAGAETALQLAQKIKATKAKFADAAINGDVGVDANGFDGLDVALTGSTTEYLPLANGTTTGYLDWTTIATQADAFAAMAQIDAFLALLDERPSALFGSRTLIARIVNIARFAHASTDPASAFGGQVNTYNGIPLIDLGDKPGASTPIVPIETRDPDAGGAGGNITGLTDLYAARLGLDGFHAISLRGRLPIKTYLPDFSTPGAVKTGEVEMIGAVALKATKAAAVLRNIKVS